MMALREWPNENNNYRIRPHSERCADLKVDSILDRYVFVCRIFIYDILNDKLNSKTLKEKLVFNNSRQTRNTQLIKIPIFNNAYLHNQSFWSAVRHFNDSKSQYVNNNERKNILLQSKIEFKKIEYKKIVKTVKKLLKKSGFYGDECALFACSQYLAKINK